MLNILNRWLRLVKQRGNFDSRCFQLDLTFLVISDLITVIRNLRERWWTSWWTSWWWVFARYICEDLAWEERFCGFNIFKDNLRHEGDVVTVLSGYMTAFLDCILSAIVIVLFLRDFHCFSDSLSSINAAWVGQELEYLFLTHLYAL